MQTQTGRKTIALQDENLKAVEPDRKSDWLPFATRDIT
jgi:hypothetical protein